MNNTVLSGNLTKDCEVRYLESGTAIISFSIAVKREMSKEDKSDFFNIKKFAKSEKVVDFLGGNLLKGKKVVVIGRVQNNNYEKDDGTKIYSTEIIADKVEFLEWGDKKEKTDNQNNGIPNGFQEIDDSDSDEIPF